jgi:hypothetical protein
MLTIKRRAIVKRYSDIKTFRENISARISEHGFYRSFMDEYHIQVLQDYRIAAAFAVGVLSLLEIEDEDRQKSINQVLSECEAVLADTSVYVLSEQDNPDNSELLEATIRKADEAVAHASNICNNFAVLFPEKIQVVVLKARDICELAMRRKRIGRT